MDQSDKPKRKHRATGKTPPGGPRAGAGRPEGSPNTLGYGEVKALKALRRRVPVDASPEDVAVADEARDVVLNVMRGLVLPDFAPHQLKAATYIRTEVCGPITQKHEVGGADGSPISIVINRTVKPSSKEE